MRVAIIGPAYPFRGGVATYNERLALELQRLGHEVRLYTFTVQYPEWLFPGKTQFRENPPPFQIDIIRRIHSLGPLSWWRAGQEIRAWGPDLAIVKFWLPVIGVSLGSVLRLLGPNTVRLTILDNLIPHETRIGDRLFTRYFIGSVEGAVALSRAVAESWRELTRKPVEALFHPVYDNYGEPVSKEEACEVLGLNPAYRYLLFFGLIRPYKGLDLLLEAWRIPSLQKFEDVKLLIAGELYEPYEKYRPLLEAPEVRERIVFHEGFVPDEKVRYYFSVSDAVVQPYRSATQSGVTHVAYHFEKPIIVTRVGGLPEVIFDGEVGYACEPSAEAIAEAIKTLLSQPLEHFVQNIRRYKVLFSWETFVERLLAFSRELRRSSIR